MGGTTIGKNSFFNQITGLVTASEYAKSAYGNIEKKNYGGAISDLGALSLYGSPDTGLASIYGGKGITDILNAPTSMASGLVNNLSGYDAKQLQEQLDEAAAAQERIASAQGPGQIVDTMDIRRRLLAAARKKQGISSTIYAGTLLGNEPVLGA
ncbi:MAG: hypothetical protein LBD46_08525 [Endomicrobium sp.]|jgi:hypothetical protein|nr:hypothetical protein [Endomicrobium sp.]